MRNDIEYVRGLEAGFLELRTAADLADAEYRDEIARLRLTDAEREAVEWFAGLRPNRPRGARTRLRAFLGRTK